jgi:hypothetical protein
MDEEVITFPRESGIKKPEFLENSKGHCYIPGVPPEIFLPHILMIILRKQGGSVSIDVNEIQASIEAEASGKAQSALRLWTPAALDKDGQIVWTAAGQTAVETSVPAALELIDHGPNEESPNVILKPDGGIQ